MDRDQFFGELFNENSANADAVREQRQLAYEERTIKRVFTECGAKRTSWGRLVNECRHITGQQNLNFNWFNSTYRHFPGVLCGRRIPRLHELTMLDIFKNPGKVKNRLAAAVATNLHRQGVNSDQPFVFVFPVVKTMFCAHNIDTETGDHPRIQWRASFRPASNTVLFIEPTISLFQTIGAEWCVE